MVIQSDGFPGSGFSHQNAVVYQDDQFPANYGQAKPFAKFPNRPFPQGFGGGGQQYQSCWTSTAETDHFNNPIHHPGGGGQLYHEPSFSCGKFVSTPGYGGWQGKPLGPQGGNRVEVSKFETSGTYGNGFDNTHYAQKFPSPCPGPQFSYPQQSVWCEKGLPDDF